MVKLLARDHISQVIVTPRVMHFAPVSRLLATFFQKDAHLNAGFDIIRVSRHGELHDQVPQSRTPLYRLDTGESYLRRDFLCCCDCENNKEFGFVSALRLIWFNFIFGRFSYPLFFASMSSHDQTENE
jgi:hypothetical protein